jgi:hypothetical protein
MELRSLACVREVVFHYDVPLTSERGGEPFADTKDVAVMGIYISRARDALNKSYGPVIKIDSQLDTKKEHGGWEEMEGYEFTVGFSRTSKERISYIDLEKVVLEFLTRVPFKPVVGTAPESLFEKIKTYPPSKIAV